MHAVAFAGSNHLFFDCFIDNKTEVEIGNRGKPILNRCTVLIHIVERILHNHTLSHEVAIVVAVFGGVDRHKHVGHNSTAAINGAAVAQCGHTQRIGKVYAIGARQFAAFITVHDVHFIVKAVAFLVWLLYASPRRSVVSSHSEAYHAAVLKAQRTLHESLAESATAHNHATVPILHGTRENLGSRRRILVHQHSHLALAILAVANGFGFVAWAVTALGVDNQFVLVKQFVAHLDGRIKITAAVVAEVND